jgi:hypothetical protein
VLQTPLIVRRSLNGVVPYLLSHIQLEHHECSIHDEQDRALGALRKARISGSPHLGTDLRLHEKALCLNL